MGFSDRQRVGAGPLGPRGPLSASCPSSFLVGYSTCHWCHMMEEESFQNEEIGHLLNENFVCVMVDREERPDVDKVYMTFVQVSHLCGSVVPPEHGHSPDPGLPSFQATSSGGGWPMNVWLTPSLQPFVGGTYFPPEDGLTRVGFRTVLMRICDQVGKCQGGKVPAWRLYTDFHWCAHLL